MSPFSRRFWSEGPGSFALAVALALFVRWALIEAYVIPSTAMLPTLLVHDHIFVNKIAYGLRVPFSERWLFKWGEPRRGDVVVFRARQNPEQFYIKRVEGVPGDRVLVENGNLYVNEKLVERTIPDAHKEDWYWLRDRDFPGDESTGGLSLYIQWEEHVGDKSYSILLRKDGSPGTFGPVTVPADQYLMLGDNRDNSEDSRSWEGENRFIPRDLLIGQASRVWLSCESTLPVVTFLCNPLTIRWKRFLHPVE